MKNTLRPLALIMALLLMLPLAACSGGGSDQPDSTPAVSGTASESAAETEFDERKAIFGRLEKKNYDGYEFKVFTQYSNYAITAFDFESLNGDVVNDAVFQRNRSVEEILNIKIVNTQGPDGDYGFCANNLKKMVTAQDDICDIMFSESGLLAPSAADGYMLNLYDIDGVDYSNPWWEQDAAKYYNIKGKLYFTHSPMHLHYYESLVTPLFNKKIAADYQLGSMYELVDNGSWTLDKMSELAMAVTIDQNGDGKMSAADDLFGCSASVYLLPYIPIGAGFRYTDTDADGTIVFNGATDKLVSITEKLQKIFGNHDNYIDDNTPDVSNFNQADGYGYLGAFSANRALFFLDTLGTVKRLRAMDSDFGILPLPKYDEAQESYKSTFYNGAAIMAVPVSNLSYDNIGAILEYLGAYSYLDIIPQYYEVNIKGKQVRDVESIPILEMMLNNITFDLCMTFAFENITLEYMKMVSQNMNIASEFAKRESAINKSIERMLDSYQS